MGQYYYAVNLTKKQFIAPHAFGDGAKLMEFGCTGNGMLSALAILLANSNGQGGGDLASEHPVVGSWAADNIVIAGDYASTGFAGESTDPAVEENLYNQCSSGDFEDVSHLALRALWDDEYWRHQFILNNREYLSSTVRETAEKAGVLSDILAVQKIAADV